MACAGALATGNSTVHAADVSSAALPEVFPRESWERRDPDALGLDAAKLESFREIVGGRGCIVSRGYLVFSWGDFDRPHDVASALKPLYSYLMMQALATGKLASLDAPVADYWRDRPALAENPLHPDLGLTFRHLGFQTACLGFADPPGGAFDYNDATMGFFWDTLMNRVFGVPWDRAEAAVIAPWISGPLGFEDGTPGVLQAKTGRFQISARDFCRFGLLMLNQGRWAGKPLLREDLATLLVADPLPLAVPRTAGEQSGTLYPVRSIGGRGNQCDHNGGYSWMWWLNRTGRDGRLWFPDVPENFFACFGHGGQEGMAVLTDQRMVVSWIGRELHQDRDRGNRAFRLLVQSAH